MKKVLLILAGILIVFRIFLPAIMLSSVNRVLEEKLGEYHGHIRDLDLSLYRGAYQIEDLEIRKRKSSEPPLISIEHADISLAWRALFKGNITMDVNVRSPRIHIADSTNADKKQNGTEEPKNNWQQVISKLVPVSLETLEIHKGEADFYNADIKGGLKIELADIELKAKDLRSRSKGELSPVEFTALLQKHAPIHVVAKVDALSVPPKADVDFTFEKFDVSSVNKTLRYYVPLDVTKGELSVFGEAVTENGDIRGYAKVFLTNGDIIAPKQVYLSPRHFLIEIAGALGNWILKNNKTKKVAFLLPFSRENGKFNVETSEAFWSAVKNTGEEMKPGLENSVSLPESPKAKSLTESPARSMTGVRSRP